MLGTDREKDYKGSGEKGRSYLRMTAQLPRRVNLQTLFL